MTDGQTELRWLRRAENIAAFACNNVYNLDKYTAVVQTVVFDLADSSDVVKQQTHQNVQLVNHDAYIISGNQCSLITRYNKQQYYYSPSQINNI